MATIPMQTNKRSALAMIPPQAWFYIIGVPIMVGGVYFLVARPLLKKFKILESKEDKELAKIIDDTKRQPYWNPNWYKTSGGATISDAEASHFAQSLKDSMGAEKGWYNPSGWGTSEGTIVGIFATLGSKGNISKVVEAYSIKNEHRDLFNDMEEEMDTEELGRVAQKISMYAS